MKLADTFEISLLKNSKNRTLVSLKLNVRRIKIIELKTNNKGNKVTKYDSKKNNYVVR